ncbi:lariat debranching enzyme A-like isoform X1 [Lytechinus pictus]|uniref:lariat debranching enzyme A-like isoform X1 n=1 Tax=Lytechinus pictus TaxID=7653 RepID=UPI00240E4B46|nr:lariat debranching enzyme A-like [Lytechinus pictus]
MRIAIEGCGHGELDKIYETIAFAEQKEGFKVDLLLCCGDFQSVRNEADMECMAVPKKYRQMNTFYQYYSGEKKVPILTIFIGGNHEASNYLAELPYGGWVCPGIYYLGYAGIVNYGGIRIGGLSGIYKKHDYRKGHFERPPYSQDEMRSAYHVRNLEVFRLKQIQQPINIMMSHDWPRGIYHHGDKDDLFRKKKFLVEEVKSNTLGSPPAEELLHNLKPDYWFSAHLHVKFSALVEHKGDDGSVKKTTKFLSTDKCLPGRDFLQILEFPEKCERPFELSLDTEWLAVLQATNHLLTTSRDIVHMPNPGYFSKWDYSVDMEQLAAVRTAFGDDLKLPDSFDQTVRVYDPNNIERNPKQPNLMINPQTTALCSRLQITDPCIVLMGGSEPGELAGPILPPQDETHSDDGNDADDDTSESSRILFESFIDSEAGASFLDLSVNDSRRSNNSSRMSIDPESSLNPEEICLSDDDDGGVEKEQDNGDGNIVVGGKAAIDSPSNVDFTPSPIKRTSLSLPIITKTPSVPSPSSGLDSNVLPAKDELTNKILFDELDEAKDRISSMDGEVSSFDSSTPRHGQIKRRNLEVYTSSSRDASDEASISDDTDRSGVLSDDSRPDVITIKGGSGSKKFKRRNVAIYTSNEDD